MHYGHFDDESREYIIERPDIPVSWTNYIGVRDMCTVLSHNAGGYSFYKSAEHHRITRFRQNGVPLDRPGHYVYIRDDETGEFWSVSWQPVGIDLNKAHYECRHGLSYSKFCCQYRGIQAEQLVFIPILDDVELWDVKIKNTTRRLRKLSIFGYIEFSFHHIEIDNQNLQMSLYASGSSYKNGVIEYDFFYEPWTYHYFTSNFDPDSYDCVRDRFLGNYRTETNPLAVEKGKCSNSSELGGNHCGVLHKKIKLAPGQEKGLLFMLGVGPRSKGKEIRKSQAPRIAPMRRNPANEGMMRAGQWPVTADSNEYHRSATTAEIATIHAPSRRMNLVERYVRRDVHPAPAYPKTIAGIRRPSSEGRAIVCWVRSVTETAPTKATASARLKAKTIASQGVQCVSPSPSSQSTADPIARDCTITPNVSWSDVTGLRISAAASQTRFTSSTGTRISSTSRVRLALGTTIARASTTHNANPGTL